MPGPTVNKRQKEKNRQDKARAKEIRRQQRRDDKSKRPAAEGDPGVDPDIAGIIPGPQPIPDTDDA
jgi:hypothetical protein